MRACANMMSRREPASRHFRSPIVILVALHVQLCTHASLVGSSIHDSRSIQPDRYCPCKIDDVPGPYERPIGHVYVTSNNDAEKSTTWLGYDKVLLHPVKTGCAIDRWGPARYNPAWTTDWFWNHCVWWFWNQRILKTLDIWMCRTPQKAPQCPRSNRECSTLTGRTPKDLFDASGMPGAHYLP